MESIKYEIVKMVETMGHASKSAIEDYMKEMRGTTGDCVSRRMRELVKAGTLMKTKMDYEGKAYYDYSIAPIKPTSLAVQAGVLIEEAKEQLKLIKENEIY